MGSLPVLYVLVASFLLLAHHPSPVSAFRVGKFSIDPASPDSKLRALRCPSCPIQSRDATRTTYEKLMEVESDIHKNKKKVVVLGSTGSIGTQTLEVLRRRSDRFECVGLAAGSNINRLAEQIVEFTPKVVALQDASKVSDLRARLSELGFQGPLPQFLGGNDGVVEVAGYEAADVVVTGIVGCAGLLPTVRAIEQGKHIALANKETLIAAGPVTASLLRKNPRTTIVPADSEHSAIFQCLQGAPTNALRRIFLTASGGAFRDWSKEQMAKAKLEDALQHPNWSMGAKITIDSATLMNKGLEVIEAHYLFGVPYTDIQVVVHPQSIIHSAVELEDSSVIAQLGWPDMMLPLLYAMSWPERVDFQAPKFDMFKASPLEFREPDFDKYPALSLAYDAGRKGGLLPAALNAANEVAVQRFRSREISFADIPRVIESTVQQVEKAGMAFTNGQREEDITLEDVLSVDSEARIRAGQVAAPQGASSAGY